MTNPYVLLISGSCAPASHSLTNVQYAQALLKQYGARTTVWDVQARPLPVHNPEDHHHLLRSANPDVRELAAIAAQADAFVWSTPVYHNSFTGTFKNALDNLSMDQLAHKPVLLISNGGGRFASTPCEHMRSVARGLLAVPIPCQIITLNDDFQRANTGYTLSSDSIRQRFQRGCMELLAYAQALRHVREALLVPQ